MTSSRALLEVVGSKQTAGAQTTEAILNVKAASPVAGTGAVSVLKLAQGVGVAGADVMVAGADMRSREVAVAVLRNDRRCQQRRRKQVGDLKAGVVVAVPERGHLDQIGVEIPAGTVFTGEDGMGYGRVVSGIARIGNHPTRRIVGGQEVLKVLAKALDIARIEVSAGDRCPDPFYEAAGKKLPVMCPDQADCGIQDTDAVSALPAPSGSNVVSKLATLDLVQDAFEVVGTAATTLRAVDGVTKKAFFELNPIVRQRGQMGAGEDERDNTESGLDVGVCCW